VFRRELLGNLFTQIDDIGFLGFTGGEPLLFPHVLDDVFDEAEARDVRVHNFFVTTNGTCVSDEVVSTLHRCFDRCIRTESSYVDISVDQWHPPSLDHTQFIRKVPFARTRDLPEVYAEGMANSMLYPRVTTAPVVISGNNIDGAMYVNCLGNILFGLDWSYESQEREVVCSTFCRDIFKRITDWYDGS